MGGTKIFVLQMKDVIKLALFALFGLALIILLVLIFIPRQAQEEGNIPAARPMPANQPAAYYRVPPSAATARYIPGTYISSIVIHDRPVDIKVTVTEDSITAIEMSELYESQRLLYPLFETLMERVTDDILFYQTADIVIHNDFPVTTSILQQAVASALYQASR